VVWSRDTTKKEANRKAKEKRNRRLKAKAGVCQGLLLVPIHRDTHIDLKTEKGGVVKGHKTKAKTKRKRDRRPVAKESICQGL
jgi:hypothetical protein